MKSCLKLYIPVQNLSDFQIYYSDNNPFNYSDVKNSFINFFTNLDNENRRKALEINLDFSSSLENYLEEKLKAYKKLRNQAKIESNWSA